MQRKVIKKTGAVIGNAGGVSANLSAIPEQGPRWFDYDLRIESEKKEFQHSAADCVLTGTRVRFAEICRSVLLAQKRRGQGAMQTLKNKSSFEIKYELPPEMFAQPVAKYWSAMKITRGSIMVGNRTSADNKSEYTPNFSSSSSAVRCQGQLHSTDAELSELKWWRPELPAHCVGICRTGATPAVCDHRLLLRWDTATRSDPTHGHYLETGSSTRTSSPVPNRLSAGYGRVPIFSSACPAPRQSSPRGST